MGAGPAGGPGATDAAESPDSPRERKRAEAADLGPALAGTGLPCPGTGRFSALVYNQPYDLPGSPFAGAESAVFSL